METWFLQRSQGYRSLGSTCTSSQHHLNSTIQNVLWKVLKDGLIISVITRPPHDKAIGHHPSFWGRQKKKVSKCISIPTICHKFETLLLCHSMFVSSITMAINVSTSRSWKKKNKTKKKLTHWKSSQNHCELSLHLNPHETSNKVSANLECLIIFTSYGKGLPHTHSTQGNWKNL